MAGKPQKYHGKYYSRINKKLGIGKYKEIRFPLNTDNKRIADSRWFEVKKYEAQIKEHGNNIKLSWQTQSGKTELLEYVMAEAVSDYIEDKKAERLKETSIDRIIVALDHFQAVVGNNYPVSKIQIDHIDLFRQYSYSKNHMPNTLNNNLSKINALLNWLLDRDKINSIPKIKMIKVPKEDPQYLTDNEWNKILDLDKVYRKHYDHFENIDEHWKRAFYFYRETGCRLSEPFKGTLKGNWLIIKSENSKSNVTRSIFIPDELIEILKEMRSRVFNHKGNNKRDCIQSYSKKFRYACDALGIDKHFHNLRDTFAVRKYLQTNDIYLVAKELGHAKVTMTEKYANFDIRLLKQDFPSIMIDNNRYDKSNYHIESYTNHRTQIELESATIVGQV